MKKALFFVIFILFSRSVYAADSKEFTFIWDVLDALKFCQFTIDYRITAKMPPKQMISDTEQANVNLERAKHVLDPYAQDKNILISKCATGIINGIDILIYCNDVLIAKLENVAGLHPGGFENAEFETARFRSQSKRGWNEFFSSLSGLSSIILESPQNKDSARNAPFKISKDERQKLAERINELFKETVATYIAETEQNILVEEKLDLHTRFTASIATIKDWLRDATY